MFFGLILRFVFGELLRVGLLTLCGMTALLVIAGAMIDAARQGLDPVAVLAVLPFFIPPTLPYTVPTCLLFACSFVYGRLSANLEITALKASGVNGLQVLVPALALAVAASAASLYLTDQFIPKSNQRFAKLILSDLQANICTYLKQNRELVMPEFPYEIYVHDVRGDRLIHPVFKHRSPSGVYDLVAMAAEATLTVDAPNPDSLEDAIIVISMVNGVATSTKRGGNIHFERQNQSMGIPPLAKVKDDKIENLTYAGCRERSLERQEEALRLHFEYHDLTLECLLGGELPLLETKQRWNRHLAARAERKALEARAEVHLRVAQSVVSIPFVLLGGPVAMLFRRRDFLHTFFICFLPIITLYYPMTILAFNIYKEGATESLLVLWAPTAIILAASLPLLRHVARH